MGGIFVTSGRVTGEGRVELDEPVRLAPGPVRVVLEPLPGDQGGWMASWDPRRETLAILGHDGSRDDPFGAAVDTVTVYDMEVGEATSHPLPGGRNCAAARKAGNPSKPSAWKVKVRWHGSPGRARVQVIVVPLARPVSTRCAGMAVAVGVGECIGGVGVWTGAVGVSV